MRRSQPFQVVNVMELRTDKRDKMRRGDRDRGARSQKRIIVIAVIIWWSISRHLFSLVFHQHATAPKGSRERTFANEFWNQC